MSNERSIHREQEIRRLLASAGFATGEAAYVEAVGDGVAGELGMP